MFAWVGIAVILELVNFLLLMALHMRFSDLENATFGIRRQLDAALQDPAEVAKAILDTPFVVGRN